MYNKKHKNNKITQKEALFGTGGRQGPEMGFGLWIKKNQVAGNISRIEKERKGNRTDKSRRYRANHENTVIS